MLRGTAASTNSTYAPRQRMFVEFAETIGSTPLPASEGTLLRYVSALHSMNRKPSTISGHLSAVRHLHLINGLPDPLPGCHRLELVKRGIAKQSAPTEQRVALTNQHLLRFLDVLVLSSYDDALFFAMATLGFFGFFRISEMTFAGPVFSAQDGLTPSDITLADGRVTILLRRSKTDKRREGVMVTLSENTTLVCPRKALSLYLRMRDARFPHLDPRTSPLFVTHEGKPVDKPSFSSCLAVFAKKIGVAGLVTPHSLRIGAATAAWKSGFSDSQIQSMGRWKSRSFTRYLRVDADTLASLSARLGDP